MSFLFYFLVWLKKGATVTNSHASYSFVPFLTVATAGERERHKQRLAPNPGATVTLSQMCSCAARQVGLQRIDVILTAPHHEVTLSLPRFTSSLKTLLQHGELTKLKSLSNLYSGKSHFARREKSSIERDHECSCYPVENSLGLVLVVAVLSIWCFFCF